MITDLNSGETLLSRKDLLQGSNTVIEGLTQTSKKGLVILSVDSNTSQSQVSTLSEDYTEVKSLVEGLPIKKECDSYRYLLGEKKVLRILKKESEAQLELAIA